MRNTTNMKIIRIAQPIEDRMEYQESPLKDNFEAEQELNFRDEYSQVSDFIEKSRDMLYDLQNKVQKMIEERDSENWDYFKQIGVL